MLSIFAFDDVDAQIDRIVAALAPKRGNLARLDIAFFPIEELERRSIIRQTSKGDTLDSEVNEWHQDLAELTLSKIAELASSIRDNGQIRRFEKSRVVDVIHQSFKLETIEKERINENLIPSLSEYGIVL